MNLTNKQKLEILQKLTKNLKELLEQKRKQKTSSFAKAFSFAKAPKNRSDDKAEISKT